jgi:hypothetical protein
VNRPHDCFTAAEYKAGYNTEPHGETHWDSWFECSICGQCYGKEDMQAMAEEAYALEDEAARMPWLDQSREYGAAVGLGRAA